MRANIVLNDYNFVSDEDVKRKPEMKLAVVLDGILELLVAVRAVGINRL